MNKIDMIELEQMKKNITPFKPGDTVKVQVKIVEGDKSRIQAFQGVVIGRQNGGIRESFTVRKISNGVGVERVFPLHSPSIEAIEVIESRGATSTSTRTPACTMPSMAVRIPSSSSALSRLP